MHSKRILIPTDIPFWHRRDGAAQRIFELVRYLKAEAFDPSVFFLGGLSLADAAAISQHGLNVEEATSSEPPESLVPKLKWYLDATWNQLRQLRPNSREQPQNHAPLTLSDFRWPWARQRFGETFARIRPHAVIVEYVKLAYLLEGIPAAARPGVLCLVDTHDILHSRCEQFRERGHEHWISINRDEEAAAISQFDVAIAIQAEEAESIRRMAPHVKTIIAGHSVSQLIPGDIEARLSTHFLAGESPTVGYLGSNNHSNTDAIGQFLTAVWPEVLAGLPGAKLLIAGKVCDWLTNDFLPELPSGSRVLENVEMRGWVEDLEAFYGAVDVAINPVEYGTGLKIKNCEPLAFGCPLITTQQGWDGMKLPDTDAVMVVEDLPGMAAMLIGFGHDPSRFQSRCLQAVQLARAEFSDEKAYLELRRSVNGL